MTDLCIFVRVGEITQFGVRRQQYQQRQVAESESLRAAAIDSSGKSMPVPQSSSLDHVTASR